MDVNTVTETPVSIRTFAEAETRLAQALPGYESREPQQVLAQRIETAINTETDLIAEAGCGTGKSFATAIPAILSGRQVVMATATKALQDQLAQKDIPFLAEHLGVPFTYALLKGRSNYLCLSSLFDADAPEIKRVVDERGSEISGERSDFGEISDQLWREVTISSEECPGKKTCAYGEQCYAELAKERAMTANLVVTNHAMLITDMRVKVMSDGNGAMLPDYDVLIVDEAHELEDYAVSMLSSRYTEVGLRNTLAEAVTFAHRSFTDDDAESVTEAVAAAQEAATALFEVLEEGRLRVGDIAEHEDVWVGFILAHRAVIEVFNNCQVATVDDKAKTRRSVINGKLRKIDSDFTGIATSGDFNVVRWVEAYETHRRRDVRKQIVAAPVDVSQILAEQLWPNSTNILTSATLAVSGSFGYVASRLGLIGYDSLMVDSPFDFDSQARIYVPDHLPIPSGSTKEQWSQMAHNEMLDLVKGVGGGALLLFTSTRELRSAVDRIGHRLGVPFHYQGEPGWTNKALAEWFKDETDGVLFATRSFMTGVDFPGDTLRLVVIDKLPFPVPTEPVTEARTELIEHRGGNSFGEYVMPVMTLVLLQAFGRLIRSKSDTGTVAILDPRLVTKGYGKKILRSLPGARQAKSFEEAVWS